MDEHTLKRLQDILGEEDIWAPPPPPPETDPDLEQHSTEMSAESQGGRPAIPKFYISPSSGSEDEFTTLSLTKKGTKKKISGQTKDGSRQAAPAPALTEIQNRKFPEYRLECGERSPQDMVFTPWNMVTGYPSRFIGKANSESASPFFTRGSLLANQTWDFFYIWDPSAGDAILLVPTKQFQHLLDIVNATLSINLTIPPGKNSARFRVTFGEVDTPRPRFLGRCPEMSESGYEALRTNIPNPDPKDDLSKITPQAALMFHEKLEEMWKAPKVSGKGKKKSAKAALKRREEHTEWGRSAKRVQRYLGLRKAAVELSVEYILPVIDMNSPMPNRPEGSVVMISFDVETYEFNHDLVTEIGFATFDTSQIMGIPPGIEYEHWFKLIKARHVRIKENAHALNRVPRPRINSEFIEEKNVRQVISDILQPPSAGCQIDADQDEQPRLVLVGHDIIYDIGHLQKLDYNVHDNPWILEVVDTKAIHQHLRRRINPASLGHVLDDMEIPHTHLHNGGNDAVYTLQALIALAFKKYEQSLAKPKAPLDRTNANDEGWSTGGELSDGGPALKPEGVEHWEDATPRAGTNYGTTEPRQVPPEECAQVRW